MKTMKMSVLTLVLVMLLTATFGFSVARADELIPDDLIVDGSTCLGLDCFVDMEFGFSTLIFKENNLRVFFDDTSTTASFPANDWEIIFNDSANGGESYMGFADREAGESTFSGNGTCVGGTNDGNTCGGFGPGQDCSGICVGGDLNNSPCAYGDSSPCLDGGGTCGSDSLCDGGTLDGQFCNYFSCAERGGTCSGAGQCVEPGAIIFRIEAGAPEDSLVIDSQGTVWIQELEVAGDINAGAATKAGIIPSSLFSNNPKTAAVIFDTPFDSDYALVLTPVSSNANGVLQANVISKTADGFTVVIKGSFGNLVEVDWIARGVGE
jgi:hypothetical protein